MGRMPTGRPSFAGDDDRGRPAPAGDDKTVNDNVAVYYSEDYWNNLPAVAGWLNTKVSGDPDVYWGEHFGRSQGRTFKRALVLNCGNGNVEHGLLGHGVIEEAVGVDYSADLLDEARRAAANQGLPLRYHQLDANTAAFPDDEFDLVVNRTRRPTTSPTSTGVPRAVPAPPRRRRVRVARLHRPPPQPVPVGCSTRPPTWTASCPTAFARRCTTRTCPRCSRLDPTEAIHSELIMTTMRRYFTVDEYVPLGGAIAYQLLTHNDRLFAVAPDDPEQAELIARVLAADDELTAADPKQSWFAYVVARPDKARFEDEAQLAAWSAEEAEREAAAADNGGEYYPHTTLQELTLESEGLAGHRPPGAEVGGRGARRLRAHDVAPALPPGPLVRPHPDRPTPSPRSPPQAPPPPLTCFWGTWDRSELDHTPQKPSGGQGGDQLGERLVEVAAAAARRDRRSAALSSTELAGRGAGRGGWRSAVVIGVHPLGVVAGRLEHRLGELEPAHRALVGDVEHARGGARRPGA